MLLTRFRFLLAALPVVTCLLGSARADAPADPRLAHARTLYEGSGFRPYTTRDAWMARAADLREQVLVATGLWPIPARCPLNATVHGSIDRGDYTVEKVFFQSYPGFYVTGNLYRPKGKTGPFPAILCPHGHWPDGRFNRTSDVAIAEQIKHGWEKDPVAARYVLQARCANLAKLGCVVFHYDMVGYADADAEHFPHRKTFLDVDSDLHAISVMGLQTWDSTRALDFLETLPDVDKSRLACTGASGGASQTFMLMATEPRLKFAAPVCMISAGDHQGGCVCENASLLRVFTDNVELTSAFAPRPFIHPTATGDWTSHYLEDGFPQTKAIYSLFGAADDVEAVRYQANHNYNLHNREAVYNFFNKQLKFGHAVPVEEQKFEAIEPKDLSVFDARHPRPANSVDAPTLKRELIDAAAKQLAELTPTDAPSLARWRAVMLPALRHLTATALPTIYQMSIIETVRLPEGQARPREFGIARKEDPYHNQPEARLPAVLYSPEGEPSGVTVLMLPGGKATALAADGTPGPLLAALLKAKQAVLAVDVFQTGALAGSRPAGEKPVEFFAGYNRTTLANRVHDVLTAVVAARLVAPHAIAVNLVGVGKAGAWCLLARGLAGDAVARTAADADSFDFDQIKTRDDENYLPASLHYGGLWPLASLAAPGDLMTWHAGPTSPAALKATYTAAGHADHLSVVPDADADAIARWLTR